MEKFAGANDLGDVLVLNSFSFLLEFSKLVELSFRDVIDFFHYYKYLSMF